MADQEECIEWGGYRTKCGYGQRHFRGKVWYAHRVAWVTAFGEIPAGMCVLHKCDNPPCVNPSHLFLGTYADNNNDRSRKGRNADMRGARGPWAKLSVDAVAEIRSKCSSGEVTQTAMARKYGVDCSVISDVVRRVSWRNV